MNGRERGGKRGLWRNLIWAKKLAPPLTSRKRAVEGDEGFFKVGTKSIQRVKGRREERKTQKSGGGSSQARRHLGRGQRER